MPWARTIPPWLGQGAHNCYGHTSMLSFRTTNPFVDLIGMDLY